MPSYTQRYHQHDRYKKKQCSQFSNIIAVIYGGCSCLWLQSKSWLNAGDVMFWNMERVLLNCKRQKFWVATGYLGSAGTDAIGWIFSCNAYAGSPVCWPGFEESDGVSFGCELSKSESRSFWLSQVGLYSLSPSRLRWPVRSIISCSSTLAWYTLVAVVAKKEWFLRNPEIPASRQRRCEAGISNSVFFEEVVANWICCEPTALLTLFQGMKVKKKPCLWATLIDKA